MRSQVRVLSLRPKNSRKQAILTCFRLFFYIFFTKSAIFSWPHVCLDFEPLDCFFTVIFPLFQKTPFLCLLRCKFWGLTVFFCQPSFLSSRQIGIWCNQIHHKQFLMLSWKREGKRKRKRNGNFSMPIIDQNDKFQFVEMVIKREGWRKWIVSPQNLSRRKQRKGIFKRLWKRHEKSNKKPKNHVVN